MKRIRIGTFVGVVTLGLALAGCGGWSTLSDKAAGLIEPELEYRDYSPKGDRWRLAHLFAPVDQRLQVLARDMTTVESFPDPSWYSRVLERHPWITSVAAVDSKGRLLGRAPETAIMPLDTEMFLDFKDDWERAVFKAFFFQTELGPQGYLVQPTFLRNEWVGLIVAQFDPRSLRAYSPEPDNLAVLHPDLPLWPATEANGANALTEIDWRAVLRDDVGGRLELDDDGYTWLARHIGDSFIIYAVRNRDGA